MASFHEKVFMAMLPFGSCAWWGLSSTNVGFFSSLSSEIVLFSCFSFVLVMYQWKLFDAHKQLIKATLVFMPAFSRYIALSLWVFFSIYFCKVLEHSTRTVISRKSPLTQLFSLLDWAIQIRLKCLILTHCSNFTLSSAPNYRATLTVSFNFFFLFCFYTRKYSLSRVYSKIPLNFVYQPFFFLL